MDNVSALSHRCPSVVVMDVATPWSIPGYAADQFVGDGPLGEVWTGRAFAADVPVLLECAPAVPPATLSALRTWGRSAVRHPHLLSARDVVGEPTRTVVVRDRAAGGSLATVLAHRGRLSPGEVVTVVAPIAAALDHLHQRGILHAAVVPQRILFDVDGRPVLAGAFVDRLLGAGAPERVPIEFLDPDVADGQEATAATDVFMLASCGLAALGSRPEQAPAALFDALIAGADPDAARRPTAGELAAAVARACTAEPVRLLVPEPAEEQAGWAPSVPPEWRTAASPAGPPPEAGLHHHDAAATPHLPGRGTPVSRPDAEAGQHRRTPRSGARARRVAVAVLAAVLLVVSGALWFRSPPAVPGPAAAPAGGAAASSTPDRWARVIDGLDAVRARAYEQGEVGLLADVWAPGDRLRADAAQLRALLATGCTARGVRHRIDRVAVVQVSGTRIRLRVTQWLPASERLRGGQVVGSFAGSPPVTVIVELVAGQSGWRLS